MRFDGKVALVAGGASGIGRASAELLLERGARVSVMDRAPAAGLDGALPVAGDVRVAVDLEHAVRATVGHFGALDLLIFSAGIQRYGNALDTTEEAWTEVLEVNLKGAWLAARAALPHLRARRGAIVNVASVQGLASQRNVLAYTVSKHGLLGLTRSMAMDYAAEGVRVNAVCPGTVDTPMLEWAASLSGDPEAIYQSCREMHPLGRIATAREVAEVVVFLAHDSASFVTGAAWTVDGGLLTRIGGSPKG